MTPPAADAVRFPAEAMRFRRASAFRAAADSVFLQEN